MQSKGKDTVLEIPINDDFELGNYSNVGILQLVGQ